jgi:hypothetical protein
MNERRSHSKDAPFVYYIFNSSADARAALLELPFIHETSNSDKLNCDHIFHFGYYYHQPSEKWDAFVAGFDLTHEMWEQLHIAFKKHNGKRKNDHEPEKTAKVPDASKGNAKKVVFLREDYAEGDKFKFLVHKAPNKEDALAFLNIQNITKPLCYIEVETPEGILGRDIDGFYEK